MKITRFLSGLLALSFLAGNVQPTFAQGTAFTYQGLLVYAGSSANGSFDLTFQLWDSVTNGSTVSGVITNTGQFVSNGLCMVTLDFGPGRFPGAARWLEIGTRTNGDPNAFAILAPRQFLAPTPYAITAANLNGVLPVSQLPTNVALLNSGATFAGTVTASTFAGSGASLTNLGAGNLTGTVANTNLQSDVALLDATNQTFTGTNTFTGPVSSVAGGVSYYMVPRGGIILWSGATNAIPAGWALCNGQNGTPNLQDQFVVGAGNTYAVAATGGATAHSHTLTAAGTSSSGAHNHFATSSTQTTDSESGHTHSVPGLSVPGLSVPGLSVPGLAGGTLAFSRNVNVIGGGNTTGGAFNFSLNTGNSASGNMQPNTWGGVTATGTTGTGTTGTGTTGTGTSGAGSAHSHGLSALNSATTSTAGAHTHTLTGSTDAANNLPPYYALCYIMKL